MSRKLQRRFHTENIGVRMCSYIANIEVESIVADIPKPLLDLNVATKEELMALKGIGPIYAKRILAYKDILGGYISVDQLGEVYGLKDHPEIIESLKPEIVVSGTGIEKVDVNSAEWKDLVKHPYIDEKVANSIVRMRETHGPYEVLTELKESHLIDEGLYAKISPYLMVIVP